MGTMIKDIVIYGMPKPDDQGWIGGPGIGRGKFMPDYVTGLDPETGQGERAVVHYTTGAQAVELEVDLDTGQVEILRGASAFDVGKAINPDMVLAQIEGGFVQGMSSALFESLDLKGGHVQNPSFVDYRIATSSDVTPSPPVPVGIGGVSKSPVGCVMFILSNYESSLSLSLLCFHF